MECTCEYEMGTVVNGYQFGINEACEACQAEWEKAFAITPEEEEALLARSARQRELEADAAANAAFAAIFADLITEPEPARKPAGKVSAEERRVA